MNDLAGWFDTLSVTLSKPLFSVGATPVTLMSLVLTVALVLGIWWMASLVERALQRVARRDGTETTKAARLYMLSRVARYTIWVLGTSSC